MSAIGVAPYNQIAVVNLSSVMTDTDGQTMVSALNQLLPTFCSDWNLKPVTAVYVAKAAAKTSVPLCCLVADTAAQPAALGYSDATNELPYSKVLVNSIMSHSGAILNNTNPKNPTVSEMVSHEVFDLLVNPKNNVWWTTAAGNVLVAGKVCDPVESNVVTVTTVNGTNVSMSDWILPSWSDPQNKVGPFNHNNTLNAPLTVDKGGYMIQMKGGYYSNVFGAEVSTYSKENLCLKSACRTAQKKCTRANCKFQKNSTIDGLEHCCKMCKVISGKHGPDCAKVLF